MFSSSHEREEGSTQITALHEKLVGKAPNQAINHIACFGQCGYNNSNKWLKNWVRLAQHYIVGVKSSARSPLELLHALELTICNNFKAQ